MSAGVNKVVITFNAWEQKIREAAAAHALGAQLKRSDNSEMPTTLFVIRGKGATYP